MDDYKPGDLVSVLDDRWAERGTVGEVVRVDEDFIDVLFNRNDIAPGLRHNVLLLTRSEIRKREW